MRIQHLSVLGALAIVGHLTTGAAQEQSRSAERLTITFEDGRLTASIQNAPLQQVLDGLAAKTQVTIIPSGDLAEERLSIELKGLALDEGLRRLLQGYDAFFYYGVVKEGPASLRTVWVYAKGRAQSLRPVAPETWASSKDLEASLASSDPAVRERAYEGLISRPDPRSRGLVLDALRGTRERDDELRQRLLSAALSQGMELPADMLADLARADRSEHVRWLALDALAENPNVKAVAEAALQDTSQAVRERAQEILRDVEAATRRSKRPEPEPRP